MDLGNFYSGNEFSMHKYLGAHYEKGKGTTFRTYAPAANRVTLIGEFSDWREREMNRCENGQFYEVTVPDAAPGQMYKYRIYNGGSFVDHCDPYGYYSELRPNNASIIYDLNDYDFKDEKWIKNRHDTTQEPMNIYEMHFGSWKKKGEEVTDWYTYREMADLIIPYLKEYNYNYLEIMPLNEYPNDLSWGYQPTGYFAPTSRYGTPKDLKYFVDQCHKNNIGVILDFVPVHFAIDGFGLANYDGTPLYNYPNNAVGMSEWGTCNFQHSRGDVCSFLNSSAYYWLDEYHFDGLRLDAVGNLIYWQGDSNRGENRDAMRFIQNFNKGLKDRVPNCLLFAEDSSSYQGVTKPVDQGGLGFDYKWDLGWMNDTLDFFMKTPEERKEYYHKLTFSMMYFYNEHFVLPFSHDEVVHGKKTIVDKMYGEYEDQFAQARALYLYMYAHPGKQLNFMGNEFGQLREWHEFREQDWDMLKYPMHDAFHHLFKDLNKLYLTHDAFSKYDYENKGFEWIDCHQEDKTIYVFKRMSDEETIVCFFNFSNKDQIYTYDPEEPQELTLLLDSNDEKYNGTDEDGELVIDVDGPTEISLPAYTGLYFIAK